MVIPLMITQPTRRTPSTFTVRPGSELALSVRPIPTAPRIPTTAAILTILKTRFGASEVQQAITAAEAWQTAIVARHGLSSGIATAKMIVRTTRSITKP